MGVSEYVTLLRDPAYTGENRCVPCTIVNAGLAIAFAGIVWGVSSAVGAGAVGTTLATGTLLAGLVSIYLRGYLVPGTPELTRQYFPRTVLEWFGKESFATGAGDESSWDVDFEALLYQNGVVTECADVDDLCLSDEFREAWHHRIDRFDDEDVQRERLLALLGLEDADVTFVDHGGAFRVRLDGKHVGRWVSQAAFHADVAAGELLQARIPEWDDLGVTERGSTLNVLRVFLDRCPDCGAAVSFDTKVVESCCWSHEVAAVSCEECGVRLFETEIKE